MSATLGHLAPRGSGALHLVPWGSHAASEHFPAPAAGNPGGGCAGAAVLRARWVDPYRRLLMGIGKGHPDAAPSPFCFTRIWGPYRLLNKFWSLGLGQSRSPGLQCISRSPSSALFCHFCAWKSPCEQPGREGTCKANGSGKLQRTCVGHLGPAASSPSRRKRNCSPAPDWRLEGGADGGDVQARMMRMMKGTIISTRRVL